MNVQRVLVLGGGSAGFLAAITLKKRLPELAVTVLRSSDIGIIGVGEGTTIPVAAHLHEYLGIPIDEFHRLAKPTWKLGIRFLNWGPRPYFDYALGQQYDVLYPGMSRNAAFYAGETLDAGMLSALMSNDCVFPRSPAGAPMITRDTAYHLENELLVGFLAYYAEKLGVAIVEDTVLHVEQDDAGVTGLRLESGRTMSADLYIDSSGFRSVLLGGALRNPFESFKASLFSDRACVGGWTRDSEPIRPYTTGEAMDSGWCWRIDHEGHINRGYVYSSSFISDDDAEREFRAKNPKITNTRVVKFTSGRYACQWVKNVVAIGNSCGFVEPMEATALTKICLDTQALAEALADTCLEIVPTTVRQFNLRSAVLWDTTRDFLAIHYKFNTRLQTPYWKACVADTDLGGAQEYVDFYRENGPSTFWRNQLIDARNPFGFEGYLSMMIGMNIPYRKRFAPPDDDIRTWQMLANRYQSAAKKSVPIAEALAYVRHPQWQWPEHLFGPGRHPQPVHSLEIGYLRMCMGSAV